MLNIIRSSPLLIALLAVATCGSSDGLTSSQADPRAELPDGYVQILQRGQITAIDEPEFVSAGEADIADEAWVLGLVIDGEARAYSLNLLNAHEIVNDRIGDTAFAAAW